MSQENYVSYQSMITDVTTSVAQLRGICDELALTEHANSLYQVKERLQKHVFSVGIMGEFRRGKSTVINALLGQDIVPSDIVPTSATLNYVRWGADKYAEIHYKDGTVENVDVEKLSDYVTKITEESARKAETVDYAVVHYPCQFCQNGVQIVDTPGLNDDDRMDAVAQKVLPTLDAIIMVLVADSPFSKSEAEFVRNKVMSSDLGRIIFVVNKIDTIDEDDRDRLLADIKKRIQTSVLEKMAAVYGKDSEEFKNTKDKLGEIRLLPISARNALKGKLKNDRRKYEESGYPEFEAMLCKLLTEERGMLELVTPINKIGSISKEALNAIDMRLNALSMDQKAFEDTKKEQMSAIKETRKEKKARIKELKAKSKNAYAELLPEMEESYTQMEDDLCKYVSELYIGKDAVDTDAAIKVFTDKISPQIDQQIKDVLSIQTERIMKRIEQYLESDVKGLEEFGREFAKNIEMIQTNITCSNTKISSEKKSNAGIASAIDAATVFIGANVFDTFIPGIGGIIAGWRDHGFKGAVVGGLSGAGIGTSAILAAGALGLMGIPAALIGGIAATFGGKAIANLLFGKKKPEIVTVDPEVIRNQLRDCVCKSVADMKDKKILEKWLKETCESSYDAVADNVDQEWENQLCSLESSLTQIQADLKKKEEDKKRVEEEMNTRIVKIQNVLTTLKPIREKLHATMYVIAEENGDALYV